MDLEGELVQLLGSDGLEIRIKEKITTFHGFLTREAAVRLIARENRILKNEPVKIRDIVPKSRNITIEAVVRKVWPVARYSSGKLSRAVEVNDDSGSAPLVLWNEDTEISLRRGDRVAISGCYEKNGEIHLGSGGSIKLVEDAGFADFSDLKEGENVHVRGIVSSIEGYDAFVHGMNTSKAFSFLISDGSVEKRAIIWEEQERGEKLREGDEIIIEDCLVNKGNLELSSDARILSRRNMVTGILEKMESMDEKMHVKISGREMELDRGNAMRFLGVSVANDINLSTVVEIKKEIFLNSRIAVKINKGEVLNACIKLESC